MTDSPSGRFGASTSLTMRLSCLDFRRYIRKSKQDKRIVKLVDAPNLPDGESVMRVQSEGLKPE